MSEKDLRDIVRLSSNENEMTSANILIPLVSERTSFIWTGKEEQEDKFSILHFQFYSSEHKVLVLPKLGQVSHLA